MVFLYFETTDYYETYVKYSSTYKFTTFNLYVIFYKYIHKNSSHYINFIIHKTQKNNYLFNYLFYSTSRFFLIYNIHNIILKVYKFN